MEALGCLTFKFTVGNTSGSGRPDECLAGSETETLSVSRG